MLQKYLIIFMAGGIVGLDTTAAWQILISHPLISSTIIGWIFGDLSLGLFFGLVMELLWMKDVPVGGAKFPEGNIGSLVGISTIILIQPKGALQNPVLVLLGLLYGFLLAHLIGYTILRMRRNNLIFVHWADNFAEKGNAAGVAWMHRLGVFHTFAHGAIWTVLTVWVGTLLLDWICRLPLSWLNLSILHIKYTFLGVGIGVIGYYYTGRKNRSILIVGLCIGLLIGILWR